MLLEEQAYPFEEKLSLSMKPIPKSHGGVYDEWVRKVFLLWVNCCLRAIANRKKYRFPRGSDDTMRQTLNWLMLVQLLLTGCAGQQATIATTPGAATAEHARASEQHDMANPYLQARPDGPGGGAASLCPGAGPD